MQDLQVDTTFAPERLWIDGHTGFVTDSVVCVEALTLRLAEPLVVRSVVSEEYGRLLASASAGRTASWSTCRSPRCRFGADADRDAIRDVCRRRESTARTSPSATRCTAGACSGDGARAEPDLQQPQLLVRQSQVTDYATATIRYIVPPSLHRGVQRRAGTRVARHAAACRADGSRGNSSCSRRRSQCGTSACVIVALRDDGPTAARRELGTRTSAAIARSIFICSAPRGSAAGARDSLAQAGEIMTSMRRSWRRAVPEPDARRRRERTFPAGTRPPTWRSSTSRCRRRRSCGATIRPRSTTSPISSSRTSSRISGGDRRSAGRTITSSG